MCFGDLETVKKKNEMSTGTGTSTAETLLPGWVTQGGQENYLNAQAILNKGFQPYTGDRVAGLSPYEQQGANLVSSTAASGNPYEAEAAKLLQAYGSTPGYDFNWTGVTNEGGPLGSIQSYMNPYLEQVLGPIMRQIGIGGGQQRMGINANATQAGAYGDARHGQVESEQRKNQAQLEADTTGKATADAWTQAMGLRTGDLSRLFATEQAQAGEDRAALDRSRASAIDLTNLDKYGVSRALGLAGALGQTGATARGVDQAKLDADYAEFARKTGFSADTIKFLAQILAGTPTNKTATGTQAQTKYGTAEEQAPNNSGYNILGSLLGGLGSAGSSFAGSAAGSAALAAMI